jgi:hypothetical protein
MEMQTLPIHSVDAAASLDSAPVVENNDASKIEQLENKRKKTSIFTTIIITIIAISIVFQLLSISTNYDRGIVILSTILGFVISVTAAYKQVLLLRLDTLRTVHNKIRMEVNRFMEENNKLTRNVDGLEDQVLRLEDVQEDLERVAQAQGCTSNELVSLVQENASTLKQQKALARAELQEQLLSTVLRTDRNGDLQIDEREANILCLRLKTRAGVEFDEDHIRQSLVETKGSLPALLNILREISEDDDNGNGNGDDQKVALSNPDAGSGGRPKSKRLIKIDDKKFMESVRTQYSDKALMNSKNSLLDD